MARGTKKTLRKTPITSKKKIIPVAPQRHRYLPKRIVALFSTLTLRSRSMMARRPHRSFRRTRKRDYLRTMPLPGYIAFTKHMFSILHKHQKTMWLLAITYTLAIIFIGGITSQDTYTQIQSLLQSSGKDLFGSGAGDIGKAGLLAVSAFAGLPSSLSVDQQIYLGISLLFAWLCTVWLLREFLLGRKPRLRDGLYNSGAPFMSTVLVLGTLLFQLIPVGIVALIYAGLDAVGIISGGFSSMLFWIFAAVVVTLVLYWVTSTIIALVVVTLPGMYPFRAIRISSDIVIGRRLRILYRLLWGGLVMLVLWMIVIIPVIIITTYVSSIWQVLQNVPIVPYVGAALTAVSTIWLAAYVYLFYRKLVDDDA